MSPKKKNIKKFKNLSIDDLAVIVQNGFSEIRAEMVSKEEFRGEMSKIRQEMATKEYVKDTMEKFIGVVRNDYDSLAYRMKKVEEVVFKSRR